MPFIRCKFYTDDGEPIAGGCKRIGICEFVHPTDPVWATAALCMHKHQPGFGGRGRGRGRGRGGSAFGSGSGDTASSGGWAGGASSAWGMPPPSGPSTSGFPSGSGWNDASASGNASGSGASAGSGSGGWGISTTAWGDAGEGPAVPKEARAKPGTSGTATESADSAWGTATGGWGSVGAAGGWGNVGTAGGWGAPTAGWAASPGAGWGSAPGWGNAEPAKDKEKETGKDPFGFGVFGGGAGPAAHEKDASVLKGGAYARGPKQPARAASPAPPSPTRSDKAWIPSSPSRSERSDRPQRDRRDSAATSDSFSVHPTPGVSPFASLLGPASPSRQASSSFSDFGGGIPRAASPSPSLSATEASGSSTRYSWKNYIKTLERAVMYQEQLVAAEAKRDSIRRLQRSRQFVTAGDKAVEKLEGLRLDDHKKLMGIQKRLSEIVNTLVGFSADVAPPDPNEGTEDLPVLADLKQYSAEVEEWIDKVRSFVAHLQEASQRPPPEPEEAALVPSKRRRAESGDSELEELFARSMKLETLADDLDIYFDHLRQSSKATIVAALEKLENMPLQRSPTAVSLEDGEVLPFATPVSGDSTPQRSLPTDNHEKMLAVAKADLEELKEELKSLKTRDHQLWRDHYKLNAENEDLKMRITVLEQDRVEWRKRITAESEELRTFREVVEKLKPRPPPPTVDELAVHVQQDMRRLWRQETVAAVSSLRQGVDEHMHAQHNVVLSQVLTTIQPTLQVVRSIQEFMDEQRLREHGQHALVAEQ